MANRRNQKRRVHVYRHPPKESGKPKNVIGLSMPLSKEGREMANKLAEEFLSKNGKPKNILTSVAVRTYETAMIFAEICGVTLPTVDRRLTGKYWEWERVTSLVSGELTALSFYQADPEFILGEAKSILETLCFYSYDVELSGSMPVFSHGGLIEPTVALAKTRIDKSANLSKDLTETFPRDLKEGEVVVFVFDGDKGDNKLVAVEMQDE